MSLCARDRQALVWIEASLAGSDPGLAPMLDGFTRLTAGEHMPEPARIRRGPVRALRRRRLLARRGTAGRPWRWLFRDWQSAWR